MSKRSRFMRVCLAAIAAVVSLPSFGLLPAGYQRCESITSDGTAYIDLGIAPAARQIVDMTFAVNSSLLSGDHKFFGAYLNNANGVAVGTLGGKWRLGSGWGNNTDPASADVTHLRVQVATTAYPDGAYFIDDMETPRYNAQAKPYTSNYTLFGIRYNGGVIAREKMTIYSFSITNEDGTAICKLVPATDSSGTPGLYDTVRKVFLANAVTSGKFTAGPNVGRRVTVAANPAELGELTPVCGQMSLEPDEDQNPDVDFSIAGTGLLYSEDGNTRGFFGSATCQFVDGEPFTNTATAFSLRVTNDLAITWNFDNVEHRLVANAREGGTVSAGGSSGVAVTNWVATGEALIVTAVTNVGYRFVRWLGDTDGVTNSLASATISLPADRPRVITALFCAATGYTSLDYVSDGLALQLDGIDNAGIGEHDATATDWIDLSPNGVTIENNASAAEWIWDDSSIYVGGTTPLQLRATLPLNYHHVTFEFYSVRDADAPNGNGSYFWGTGSNWRFNWYWSKSDTASDSTIWTPGVNYAARLNYADGPHVARMDGTKITLWSSDALNKTTDTKANTSPDEDVSSLVHIGKNYSIENCRSKIQAFRIYNRALSDKEIRWNAALDRVRFAGESAEEGEVIVTATPINVAAPSPGYGARMLGLSTNNTFTIGGLVTDDHDGARIAGEYAGTDVRYVYTGYTFTNGVVNPVVVSGADESMAVEKISLFNDLVWKFRKEYRTVVTSPLGGTVTVAGVSGSCVTNFTDGGTLTIRATPDTAAGYSFFEWRGDVSDIDDPTQQEIVVPVQSRNLVATYTWEDPEHVPVTTAWKPSTASGEWNDPENWDNGVPQKGDTVIISNVAANTTLTIPMPTAELVLLAVGNTNGKTTTLVQDGWNVSICAETIDLGQGVTVTCADACTYGGDLHRVHLRGTNLFLRAGAKIDVDKKGYKKGQGLCWKNGIATYAWAGPGGAYGGVIEGASHFAYGSAEFPVDPGSGATDACAGGGAVRLDFSGVVVIDGDVTANGEYIYTNWASGSGGGIWITSRTIAGSGRVLANARNPWEDNFSNYRKTGGGGRVAVHYDTTAQNAVSCGVRFEARGGLTSIYLRSSTDSNSGNSSAWNDEPRGGAGTIWFSDNRFLTAEPYATDGWKFAGVWCSPTPVSSLEYEGDLLLDASYVVFPSPSFALTVGGKMKATGVGFYAQRENGLVLSNATVNIAGDLELYGARIKLIGGSLSVGGDATLDGYTYKDQAGTSRNLKNYELGGGEISVKAAPTVEPGMVGATVTVGGTLYLAARSIVKPYCDLDTGSIVAFRVKNLTMDANSYFDATMKGFGDRRGPGAADTVNYAASHGGKGGAVSGYEENVAETYGKRRHPILPGSGAGANTAGAHGFKGGGVIYVTATDSMTLNGSILADANRNHVLRASNGCPGSSGGSVYLVTRKLRQSTGSIYARGGVASSTAYSGKNKYCTGGGGRIAIFYGQNRFDTPEDFASFTSNVSAAAGVVVTHDNYSITAWTDETHSDDGTVVWGRLAGQLIIVK